VNVVILHGIQSSPESHWLPWLRAELVKLSHDVVVPELPGSERPDRSEWLNAVRKVVADPTQTVFVGHSLGVTTALDFIEACETPVGGLVSVAGFAVDYGSELNSYFLSERKVDFTAVRKNLQNAAVFYGDNDPYVTQDALQQLADELDVAASLIPGGGHLNADAGYTEFPMLLEAVVAKESPQAFWGE